MSNNQRSATSKNQISKPKPGKKARKKDFMLNGIHERGLNKDEHIKVKLWRYPGASSIDISDHKKPSLRKEPEKL